MQITVDPDLRNRIVKRAERQGVSIAEYVRDALARDLGAAPAKTAIQDIFDLGRSAEKTDIAHDKKRMISEAILHRRLK